MQCPARPGCGGDRGDRSAPSDPPSGERLWQMLMVVHAISHTCTCTCAQRLLLPERVRDGERAVKWWVTSALGGGTRSSERRL